MATPIPEDLTNALRDKKCGVFVGAGASTKAGLPDWTSLLSELIDRVKRLPMPQKTLVRDLKLLLKDKSKQLMLASVLKDELGQDFSKFIETRFADDKLNPTKLHRAILGTPAQFIITTNYDNLLERAYSEKTKGKHLPNTFTYKQAGEVASCLHRDKFFILKAHGDAHTAPDEIVLTEKDYRGVIHHEPGYQSLLQTLFTTFTILFVGTSFTDVELQLLLGYIHSSFHGKTPAHYAIVAENKSNPALIKAWRKDFNIHVINVSPHDDYKEVLAFVSALNIKAR